MKTLAAAPDSEEEGSASDSGAAKEEGWGMMAGIELRDLKKEESPPSEASTEEAVIAGNPLAHATASAAKAVAEASGSAAPVFLVCGQDAHAAWLELRLLQAFGEARLRQAAEALNIRAQSGGQAASEIARRVVDGM